MSVAKNRLVLVTIFALFFIPVIAAVLMQSRWWQFTPQHTVNRGTLVQPPVPIALSGTGPGGAPGTWSLLYPLAGGCTNRCQEDITGLRQIHRAAGRHREDLDVVVLGLDGFDPATRDRLLEIYAEFRLVEDPDGAGRRALELALERLGEDRSGARGRGYVVDPDGNLILAYPPHFNPSDMNKDLRRLLKGSERWESDRPPSPGDSGESGGATA